MDTIKRNSKSGAPPLRFLSIKRKMGGKKLCINISEYAKTAVLLRFCVVSKIEYKYVPIRLMYNFDTIALKYIGFKPFFIAFPTSVNFNTI